MLSLRKLKLNCAPKWGRFVQVSALILSKQRNVSTINECLNPLVGSPKSSFNSTQTKPQSAEPSHNQHGPFWEIMSRNVSAKAGFYLATDVKRYTSYIGSATPIFPKQLYFLGLVLLLKSTADKGSSLCMGQQVSALNLTDKTGIR